MAQAMYPVAPDTVKLRSGVATITATTAATAQALGAVSASAFSTGLKCHEVLIQAAKANTVNVRIGNKSDGPSYELAANENVRLTVKDLNDISAYLESGTTASLNWIART